MSFLVDPREGKGDVDDGHEAMRSVILEMSL